MASRGFELVSPRIWGRTVYVFAACADQQGGGCGEPSRNAQLQGYVRWAGSEDPEIRTRASTILRRLGFNVQFEFMNSSQLMAGALRGSANGGKDFVCIFEEEPSGFLIDFASQLKTRARLLAIDRSADAASLEVTNGIPSVAVPYDTQRFYRFSNPNIALPAKPDTNRVPSIIVTPPPAIPDPRAFTLPLLLTNARKTGELGKIEAALKNSLPQVTSVAYLRTLFDEDESRCDSRDRVSSEQFKTVLLNSFLTDRSNPYAVLGLFGHLVFSKTSGDARAVEVFAQILRDEYKVSQTSAEGVTKWLRDHPSNQTRITKVDLRARFANYPSEKIYSETIAGLGPALRTPQLADRRRLLERARDTLVSLAEVALPSTCGKREVQRGLWTGMDFEPFFYLAVINAALTEIGPAQ